METHHFYDKWLFQSVTMSQFVFDTLTMRETIPKWQQYVKMLKVIMKRVSFVLTFMIRNKSSHH